MPRRSWPLLAALVLLAPLPALAQKPPRKPKVEVSRPTPPRTGVPVARVLVMGGEAEHSEAGRQWESTGDGYRMKTGDRLRTGPTAVARIEFPWMTLNVGPDSTVWIPGGIILSTVLEEGRVQIVTQGGDLIKLKTAEAEVRGRGHAVVRREGRSTLISAMAGTVQVQTKAGNVSLLGGQGTVVRAGAEPAVVALAPPPKGLRPGPDPLYVVQGASTALEWTATDGPFHVEVLSLDSDGLLVARDADGPPQTVQIPWLGTFRWRVARRDASGLEGLPSPVGYVCVVEK